MNAGLGLSSSSTVRKWCSTSYLTDLGLVASTASYLLSYWTSSFWWTTVLYFFLGGSRHFLSNAFCWIDSLDSTMRVDLRSENFLGGWTKIFTLDKCWIVNTTVVAGLNKGRSQFAKQYAVRRCRQLCSPWKDRMASDATTKFLSISLSWKATALRYQRQTRIFSLAIISSGFATAEVLIAVL